MVFQCDSYEQHTADSPLERTLPRGRPRVELTPIIEAIGSRYVWRYFQKIIEHPSKSQALLQSIAPLDTVKTQLYRGGCLHEPQRMADWIQNHVNETGRQRFLTAMRQARCSRQRRAA